MQEAPPVLPRSRIAADPSWTPQEQWVWECVQAGEIADFNTREGYGAPLDPKDSQDWPDTRILRSTFLETVLLLELYRTAIPHHGLRIVGAWYPDPLDLFDAPLACQLWLEHSRFEAKVDLSALRTSHWISLEASVFKAPVEMTAMQSESYLVITGAAFSEKLDMNSLHVGQRLLCAGATFAEVDLGSAQIGGDLGLSRATVSGGLSMNGLRVGQGLLCAGATFAEVDLGSARIGGDLNLSQATVSEKLNMNGLHVEGNLFMGQEATFAEVALISARIGGQFNLSRATVSGKLSMNGLHVGQGLFMRQSVFARDNPGMTITLSFAKIDGMLDLSGANLPSLNLTSTRIGGDLRFAEPVHVSWQPEAQLHLYNTEVVGMQDAHDASPPIVWLEGFTYGRLAELAAANTLSRTAQKDLRVSLTDWLSRQKQYTPQPYEQLASVLQKAGYKSLATRMLFESKKREQYQARYGWLWLVLGLQRILIGYGYYNFRVLGAVIVFLIAGVAVLHFTGERHRLHMSSGLSYSIDMLLPIIKLNKKHEEVILQLNRGARWYFYFHQIVGYILASFLVAGLAGLTKKTS